jgi:biopolymer transport protein ExbD
MAKSQSTDTEISDINIVPLVDIILVVLIIFMITSQAQKQNQIDMNLPEASFSDKKSELPISISVNKSREIFINQKLTDLNELRGQLGSELNRNPEISAVVSADKDLDYGYVITVLDIAKSAGVKELSVTTVENP